jgi:hypothetical protein
MIRKNGSSAAKSARFAMGTVTMSRYFHAAAVLKVARGAASSPWADSVVPAASRSGSLGLSTACGRPAEAGVPGADDRFAAVCDLELGEDRGDVVGDRFGGDGQSLGEAGSRKPMAHGQES